MTELEKLIIESTGCNEHVAKIKAKSMTSQFVVKNPEHMLEIQANVMKSQEDKISQLNNDKFILASNHLAFMASKPKPNSAMNFLELKGMELPIKGESFDNFVIKNGLGLVKPD